MAVLGLQGVRGGVGTTTITAALAWSLQMLGENVLVVEPARTTCCACHLTLIYPTVRVGQELCWWPGLA